MRHLERLLEELGVRGPHPIENSIAKGGQEERSTPSGRMPRSLRHSAHSRRNWPSGAAVMGNVTSEPRHTSRLQVIFHATAHGWRASIKRG